MDKGIFATVEHRKLMELKNCGAVCPDLLEARAQMAFLGLRSNIKYVRARDREKKGFLWKLLNSPLPVDTEVDLMFSTRQELVEHIEAIEVPSELCPLGEDQKEDLLFLDRAARYAKEAQKVLDMFKRHHEVIVDSDRSLVIEWILQNSTRIRAELN